MRKVGKAILLGACIGIMAFVLAACSSSGGGSAESESTVSSDVPKDVFVVAKATRYQDDGTILGTTVYERDEHGNTVQQITSSSGDDVDRVMKFKHDEYGNTLEIAQSDGQVVTYENTLDGDKVVKSVGSNGSTTEGTFYDNGTLKERITQFGNEYKEVITYDENGYEVEHTVTFGTGDSAKEAVESFTWEFDGTNTPISLTKEMTKLDGDITTGGISVGAYKVECDADGNISKLINEETGNAVLEVEYIKVEDPSVNVRRSSHIKITVGL